MDNWKIVFSSMTPLEVNLAKNFLESEGIATELQNELASQIYSSFVEQTKLLVKENDVEQATKILIDRGYIKIDANEQAIALLEKSAYANKDVCPYCGSKNISISKESEPLRRFMFSVLGLFNPLFRGTYRCANCKKTWKYVTG